jgi:hypothetical protein
MDSNSIPAPLAALAKPYDCDSEFEWLLCLCSAYQSKNPRLFGNGISMFRAAGKKRIIDASTLRGMEGRDLPPDARVPIKSPVHTLRDASRRRSAG